jgi:hypothetical protein
MSDLPSPLTSLVPLICQLGPGLKGPTAPTKVVVVPSISQIAGWTRLWGWYENGGYGHVAAYLAKLDLSDFDPKAPPPKTAAFWDIVDASRAPEDAELADVLDGLGKPDVGNSGAIILPDAVTLQRVRQAATGDFETWIRDRRNRRQIPYRFERCGYVPVRNEAAESGLWVINGTRQVIYAKASLSLREQLIAARKLMEKAKQSKQ